MLTLQGQTGKAMDATARSCALLKIRDLSFKQENLGDDSLTWTARTADLLGSMTILPDFEQTVSLFNGSTRIFHGHVSDPADTMYGTVVTVLGPTWWLKRTPLSSAGTAGDRPTLMLAQNTVGANITAILTRAIAKGVPIRIGSIPATFTIPKQQISEANFMDALADQMKFLADATGWWDYSSGLPAFNITRRAGALDTVYTIQQSGNQLTGFERLKPRGDLLATRVELTYMTRGAGNVPVQQVQSAGTASAGHTQIVAISGPERDTFVPKEDYDNVNVQTTDANVSINTIRQHLLGLMPEVVASRARYGGRPFATDVTLANGEQLTTNSMANQSGTTFSHPQPQLLFLNETTGNPVSVAGKHLLLSADPPEWLSLAGMERVKITGRIYVLVAKVSAKSPYNIGDQIESTPPPDWANVFAWSTQQYLSRTGEPPSAWGTTTSFTQPSFYNRHQNQLWALDFEIPAVLTTTSYPTLTTVYKPAEFDYLVPPAGMASALLATQAWTPWEGSITRRGSACDGSNLMNRKFNLGNSRAAHATMGALPRSVTYEFRSKTVRIELGPPYRHDTGSLAQRFRQPAQTNITYL